MSSYTAHIENAAVCALMGVAGAAARTFLQNFRQSFSGTREIEVRALRVALMLSLYSGALGGLAFAFLILQQFTLPPTDAKLIMAASCGYIFSDVVEAYWTFIRDARNSSARALLPSESGRSDVKD